LLRLIFLDSLFDIEDAFLDCVYSLLRLDVEVGKVGLRLRDSAFCLKITLVIRSLSCKALEIDAVLGLKGSVRYNMIFGMRF
jgi:hypothetical protein